MNASIINELKKIFKGEVSQDANALAKCSHDASIFEVIPSLVTYPTDNADVENIIKFVSTNKKDNPDLYITARSAGTDMSGGSLGESIVLSFTEHLNKISEVVGSTAIVEPGAYYRDFEKTTLEHGLIFPAYPSSREICAIGGMIGNNCGGEKSLEFGKTERYVEKLKVVLADGQTYEFKALDEKELAEKLALNNFEGNIYKQIFKLINDNYDEIKAAKPNVSKNSSGYYLWNVYDKATKIFDLTKLFVGSQGTLGVIVEATLKLVPVRKHAEMVIIYMGQKDIDKLGDVINTVLITKPESFETYDDNTLKLALKYFPEFAAKLGTSNIFSTAFQFLPEFLMSIKGNMPKLVLQVEFTGDDLNELKSKAEVLRESLKKFNLQTKIAGDETQSRKYWLVRRDSFRLLKEKIKDKYASPFIDDFVVNPEYLSEFLPRFNAIMAKYTTIISTVAGHIGDGNFHIIPLVNLRNESDRKVIEDLSRETYDLVFEYHGTTNGEHNDGLIRTPYLKDMFGEKIYNLFLETKKIFDPISIFNPGKKTNSSIEYMMGHIRTNW